MTPRLSTQLIPLIHGAGHGFAQDVHVLVDLARAPYVSCLRERSEEHTSELQSQSNLVCRLLLEKKKNVFFVEVDANDSASMWRCKFTQSARATRDVADR